ncbi:hypothetical protein CROQUDRAFT_27033, partial [Cronartium quercuum f. sp. fusiforme G11]
LGSKSNMEQRQADTMTKERLSGGTAMLSKIVKIDQIEMLKQDRLNWEVWDHDLDHFSMFTPGAHEYLRPKMIQSNNLYDQEKADYVYRIISWIVGKSIGLVICHLITPADNYRTLNEKFFAISFTVQMEGFQKVVLMRFDGNLLMFQTHLEDMQDMAAKLARLGLAISDDVSGGFMLLGIPASFGFLEHYFEHPL